MTSTEQRLTALVALDREYQACAEVGGRWVVKVREHDGSVVYLTPRQYRYQDALALATEWRSRGPSGVAYTVECVG